MRTGWDNKESLLTYRNVNSSSFGLLQTVTLNDQVERSPSSFRTKRQRPARIRETRRGVCRDRKQYRLCDRRVNGAVLFQQNLGSPVPTPLGWNNNGPNVGIDGTPVIDRNANAMYVIAYTMQPTNVPVYYIHNSV